jgi:hypothetical protein
VILHAVPSFINAYEYGAGNWKAAEANRLALHASGLPVRELNFDANKPSTVVQQVTPDTGHLLLEYSVFPDLLARLRQNRPDLGLHVRTHNAEPYQHIHRSAGDGIRGYASRGLWTRTYSLLRQDIRCRQTADTLLGISEWDNSHYWRWLPGKAALRYLPYFSPWPELRPGVTAAPWQLRRPAMVSMGGNFDPSGLANVANFNALATQLSRATSERWSFELTWWSQWHDQVPDVVPEVNILRACEEPWDLLCEVRALAVLTPLGFGLKTTVVDGLAAGCKVIVHPTLARHLPVVVRNQCLVCDPSRDEDVHKVIAALAAPPPVNDLNARLRQQAVATLRSTVAAA